MNLFIIWGAVGDKKHTSIGLHEQWSVVQGWWWWCRIKRDRWCLDLSWEIIWLSRYKADPHMNMCRWYRCYCTWVSHGSPQSELTMLTTKLRSIVSVQPGVWWREHWLERVSPNTLLICTHTLQTRVENAYECNPRVKGEWVRFVILNQNKKRSDNLMWEICRSPRAFNMIIF